MLIKTKYHQEVEINEREIIQFEEGIPGFIEEKKFVFLPLNDELFVLQSTNEKNIAFVTINPFTIQKDYEFSLDDNTIEQLKIDAAEDVTVYSIMSVRDPFNTSTINLAAPVVINYKARLGKQVILEKADYSIRTPLLPAAEQKG
ncbi:flagellar assembly protein FliW [Peribacillus kribbensis]|uniref:flagellar assembly protein FliW n=1 Tax=Peribacillus kribbensis TaxID=356658 RepID=UPI000422B1FA|nr:flagellar assembly protein FliW [Peribacillus kribbensis]